jgi:hypothetical protein
MYSQEWSFGSRCFHLGRSRLLKNFRSVSEHEVTRFVSGHGFTACGKNSGVDFVLKGRGFKPRRKCHKINPALAAEAAPQTAMPLFQQTVQPLGTALSAAMPVVAQLTENF